MQFSTNMSRGFLVVLSLVLIGIAPSTSAESSSKPRFENFLVIGISGDYETRAQFERVLVSQLRKKGAAASTYHSVIGGNKAIIKDDVIAAIREHGFDAVLAIRKLDGDVQMEVTRSRTEIDAEPIGGRIVNLFRSNYRDYTNPGSVDLAAKSTIAVELYSAETEEIVYQFDHETKRETNIGLLIDQTAGTIAKKLDRQDLIAN
jgi:hypothetical protein